MLRKAVDAHSAAAHSHNSLKQQLFPSSSPTTQDARIHSQRYGQATRNLSTNNPLRPSAASVLNGVDERRAGSKCAVKRTSSGLAKALGGTAPNIFDEFPSSFGSQENPIIPDHSPSKQPRSINSSAGVLIDEDDFDTDLDLDIEDPATKQTISYPPLPPLQIAKQAIAYPSIQRANLNVPASYDSGYHSRPPTRAEQPPPSSVAIPWSSSPPEHSKSPPRPNPFASYAFMAGHDPRHHTDLSTVASNLETSAAPTSRPTKRRTLPWLESQTQDHVNTDQNATGRTSGSKSKVRTSNIQNFTPLAKNSKAPSYPWNTTASAIKEQQKQLRQASKKLIRVEETTDAVHGATVASKKKKAVARPHLSAEQRHVLDLVVDYGKSVFFTGSAGTGKSVLLREIIAVLRKKYQRESDRVAITASTGLAACNIGGVTLHSFAGIGLGKEEVPELVKKIKRNQKAKHRWMRTKVLIIDEISMVDGDLFDKLEGIARIIRNNGRPFGGIQLVITGDFFQLPPVPDYNKVATFAFDAKSWSSGIEHTIGLHHVFRQKDPKFANMLNEMREGRLSQDSISVFRKLSRPLDFHDDMTATELFPTRNEVDAANNARMRMLSGDVRMYEARDGGTIVDKAQRDKLLQNCMAPQALELKKGSQVMLIKNIDEMLVNGSLGLVMGFMSESLFDSYNKDEEMFLSVQNAREEDLNPDERKLKQSMELQASTGQLYPVVRFAVADGSTRDLLCNRETWKVELPNGEVQASRAQVPLILAWALSIHKAQGQTLERVKVDLGKVFEKGQAYVALSRATTMNGLQVLRFDPAKIVAHPRVRTFYAGLSRAEGSDKAIPGEFPGDDFDVRADC